MNGSEIPQWKRDLIARLKHQNKKVAAIANGVAAEDRQSQQPSDPEWSVGSGASNGHGAVKMVQQDRTSTVSNGFHPEEDSDPEDLHYGPGIVKKLKNKYLSLALRETAHRPSVLQLRKATSLENLLDEDRGPRQADDKLFHSRIAGNDTRRSPHKNNRYRHANGMEIKRARSVEVISVGNNFPHADDLRRVHNNRQSLHEESFLDQKPYAESTFTDLVHKNPMELMAIQNASRTSADSSDCSQTSTEKTDFARDNEVVRKTSAEKTSADSSDCSQTSSEKTSNDEARETSTKKTPDDVVRKACTEKATTDSSDRHQNSTDFARKNLAPTDVVRKTSSEKTSTNRPKRLQARIGERERPPQDVVRHAMMIFERRPEQRTRPPKQTGEVAAKVDTFNTIIVKAKVAKKMAPAPCAKGGKATVVGSDKFFPKFAAPLKAPPPSTVDGKDKSPSPVKSVGGLPSPIPDVSRIDQLEGDGDARLLDDTPDLILTSSPLPKKSEAGSRRPPCPPHVFVNGTKSAEMKTPVSEPLAIDVNGGGSRSPPLPGAALLLQENGRAADKKKKKTKMVAETSNTAVFNFTGRKDVPDYIANDSSRSPCRPELPKPGEGGIILIPGATILESFTDEDEEILKSLECPPSPCDVTFINDNVLIDGKSSLSQRTAKQAKLSISFLDGPEVYEYPSETSMMIDEDPSTSHLGHTVPNLSGSSLANYTPKSTEEFRLGVSRTLQPTPTPDVVDGEAMEMEEEEAAKPFSEGDIADMLF